MHVAVLGARSLVADYLIDRLCNEQKKVLAFSRNELADFPWADCTRLDFASLLQSPQRIPPFSVCISLMPIWILQSCLDSLLHLQVEKLIVLSSTSSETKQKSNYKEERDLAEGLNASERKVIAWADKNNVELIIFRTTMIYGDGKDKNITAVARFIGRFGFFPVVGEALGLRQPVHADDVAQACCAAIERPSSQTLYNLSGGEKLTYRQMVERVFKAKRKKVRFFKCPRRVFQLLLDIGYVFVKTIPRGVGQRMNEDMVFDHSQAKKDFCFCPREFMLGSEDISFTDD